MQRSRWIVWMFVALAPFGVWRMRADRTSAAWFRDDDAVVLPLADAVAEAVLADVGPGWTTGDARFDGEWTLVTCQMAVLGLGHVVLREPEHLERYREPIRACAAFLRTPEARAFATAAWGEDGLSDEALASDRGHAWLGWLGAAQAMAVRVGADPDAEPVSHAIADALARRVDRLPLHAVETYPGETYPPDLAAVAAAIALDGRHDDVLARLATRFRAEALDPTGLVVQALNPATGEPADAPRGSGTAVSAFFWAHADPVLAHDLAVAARDRLDGGVLGFGGVREVPRGSPSRADVDSGPVLFGMSVAASGFGLAAARAAGDPDWHAALYRSAHLAGVSTACGDQRWFATGGTLGNAILLAMLTAPGVAADDPTR